MNKKIIILILAVFCIASTILLSVLGKVPEQSNRIAVETIMFVDSSTENGMCEVGEDGVKIIKIKKGTTEYQLEWLINPSEATEKDVQFQILTGQEYSTINETGLVTFTQELSVTIKIYSNMLDFKSDVVTIEFTGSTVTVEPDNPF